MALVKHAGTPSPKGALNEGAVADLRSAGLPTSLRMLVFPTGATIPGEIAAQAVVDTLYRPVVTTSVKREGSVDWYPCSMAYTESLFGEEILSLKPGPLYSRNRIDTSDKEVGGMVVQARAEAAARKAEFEAVAQVRKQFRSGGTETSQAALITDPAKKK